ADPATVGLRILVVVVRTQRQPTRAGGDLVLARALRRVERGQERPLAVELAAGHVVARPDAVVRRSAEDRAPDRLCALTVLHVVADRKAAARIADQHHL